jgi:hypothetical protein
MNKDSITQFVQDVKDKKITKLNPEEEERYPT